MVTLACFSALAAAMLLLLGTDWSAGLALPFVVLFGSGYGIVSVVRPVIAREILGNQAFGAKTGMLALFYLLGAAVAPFLGALIWTVGGYQSMLVILLVFIVIGLTLYRIAWRESA
jgi:MFS family permease